MIFNSKKSNNKKMKLNYKKTAFAALSSVVFCSGLTFSVYELTKEPVLVDVDGEKIIVKTHANTVEEVLSDLDIQVDTKDKVLPNLNSEIKQDMEIKWVPAKNVDLFINGEKKSLWTTAENVKGFLKEQKIELGEHDVVITPLNSTIEDDMDIQIETKFEVNINVDGETKPVWTIPTTIEDLLITNGITLGELDRVEPTNITEISEPVNISIIRVEKVTDTVEEIIPFKTVNQNDSSLYKGQTKVIQNGQNGKVSKTYEVVKENGKEVSRTLLDTRIITNSQNKIVAVGTKAKPVTKSYSSSKEMTVTATAYTPYCNGCSGISAYGINLRNNPNLKLIAVDPNVIPLGTRVWVEGYGEAIAGDTGGAIKGKKIDLLMQTKEEAYKWGRRTVKIKILD